MVGPFEVCLCFLLCFETQKRKRSGSPLNHHQASLLKLSHSTLESLRSYTVFFFFVLPLVYLLAFRTPMLLKTYYYGSTPHTAIQPVDVFESFVSKNHSPKLFCACRLPGSPGNCRTIRRQLKYMQVQHTCGCTVM